MPRRSGNWPRLSALALTAMAGTAHAADPRLDALASAYPDKIARHDATTLFFRDGTSMPVGSENVAKPFEALLRDASVLDQFRLAYPKGAEIAPPAKDFDPGRFRNQALFDKLYGDCRRGEVAPRLVSVGWLGHAVQVTGANGVADHLGAVAAEIAALPESVRSAAWPIAGTYSCRTVKDTGRRSMHAYGAAIDLNLKFSNYWLWEAKGGTDAPYRNAMPRPIVDAFERHGFIWGGRWHHYDTMHFEYRPELLAAPSAPR
jgi:D-alanyl-D-alanine carboxypeptidase-like protein